MKKRRLFIAFVVLLLLSACDNQADDSVGNVSSSVVASETDSDGDYNDVVSAIQAVELDSRYLTDFEPLEYDGNNYYESKIIEIFDDIEQDEVGWIRVREDGEYIYFSSVIYPLVSEYVEAACKTLGIKDIDKVKNMMESVEEGTAQKYDINGYRVFVSLVDDGINWGDINDSFGLVILPKRDVEDYVEGEFIASRPRKNTNEEIGTQEVSTEYKNALSQAQFYSDDMHMSKQAIYDQLTSEHGGQFPADAAQYAVDNVIADFKANALETAKFYYTNMSMSKESIRQQLTSEHGGQFTAEEADYAISNLA